MVLHGLFEVLAYAVGFAVYRRERARRGDFLEEGTRWSVVVAAILGAALASKLLHHLAHPSELGLRLADPRLLLGGKTIVGGLLGGWIAVELVKRRLGIRRRTGDLFAVPLAVGIAVGRIGCFLAGLADDTYGIRTSSFLGVDLGDGVGRHPVQLYEAAALLGLAAILSRERWFAGEGARFRAFLASYLVLRLALDFLKPYETVAGLGVLQWACLAGLAALTPWPGSAPRVTAERHASEEGAGS